MPALATAQGSREIVVGRQHHITAADEPLGGDRPVGIVHEGGIGEVLEADGTHQLVLVVDHEDRRMAGPEARLEDIQAGRPGDQFMIVAHYRHDPAGAQESEFVLAIDRDIALRELPVEITVSVEPAGDESGHRHRSHQGEGDAIVGGQLEDHDDGGDRRAERTGGDRPHADDGVDRRLRAERGNECRCDRAEGSAGQCADGQARREYAASHATAVTERGGDDLGDGKGDEQVERRFVEQRVVRHHVADAQNFGIVEGDEAQQQPAAGGLKPEGCAQPLVDGLHEAHAAHQHDCSDGAEHAQENEGRHFPETLDLLGSEIEGRVVADVQAGHDGADQARYHHRRECPQPVMADHDLEREENAGNRSVEGGGHRGGDAASQQRAAERRAQMKPVSDLRGEAGTQMDDRTLPADRAADADRAHAVGGGRPDAAPGHPSIAQGTRFDDVRDTLWPAVDEQETAGDAEGETARCRDRDQEQGSHSGGRDRHLLLAHAVDRQRDDIDQQTKGDRSVAGRGTDRESKHGQADLVVAHAIEQAPRGAGDRVDRPHDGSCPVRSFRVGCIALNSTAAGTIGRLAGEVNRVSPVIGLSTPSCVPCDACMLQPPPLGMVVVWRYPPEMAESCRLPGGAAPAPVSAGGS